MRSVRSVQHGVALAPSDGPAGLLLGLRGLRGRCRGRWAHRPRGSHVALHALQHSRALGRGTRWHSHYSFFAHAHSDREGARQAEACDAMCRTPRGGARRAKRPPRRGGALASAARATLTADGRRTARRRVGAGTATPPRHATPRREGRIAPVAAAQHCGQAAPSRKSGAAEPLWTTRT